MMCVCPVRGGDLQQFFNNKKCPEGGAAKEEEGAAKEEEGAAKEGTEKEGAGTARPIILRC